jgi:ABC-type transporter lipoprotein component MlaA
LNNLKGTIFYVVPHIGGGEDFKQFFVYQSQRFNAANKKRLAKSGILKNIEGFNRQMADLSVDFEIVIDPTLNIYAFDEGRPIRRGVSFSSKSLNYNNDYQHGSV